MKKILLGLSLIVLLNCTENTSKQQSKSEITIKKNDTSYNNWQIQKTSSLEFKYPKDWRIKIKTSEGITQFGLTNSIDTAVVFFPIEIWEFPSTLGSYKEFSKYMPNEYFKKVTDGKYANRLSSDSIKFKTYDANKFEFMKDSQPVEIITVNGVSRYYLLVFYKNESTKKIANNIFNSINISK